MDAGILFDLAHYDCAVTGFANLDERSIPWIQHVLLDVVRDGPGKLSDWTCDPVLPGRGILDLAARIGRIETDGYTGAFSIERSHGELWRPPAAGAVRLCL